MTVSRYWIMMNDEGIGSWPHVELDPRCTRFGRCGGGGNGVLRLDRRRSAVPTHERTLIGSPGSPWRRCHRRTVLLHPFEPPMQLPNRARFVHSFL